MKFDELIWVMKEALGEANKAYSAGEVPVGAIIVNEFGKIISRAHNVKEESNNPVGHAEILAVQSACKSISNWRLNSCTLVVTLEPCLMCAAALVQARIGRVVFGAYDLKGGAFSLGYNYNKDKRLNHTYNITGGILHYECSSMLSQFFKERRK